MPELLPFCKIKLQYLLEMVADHELDDNAHTRADRPRDLPALRD